MTPQTLTTVLDVLDTRKRQLEDQLSSNRPVFKKPLLRKYLNIELENIIKAIEELKE